MNKVERVVVCIVGGIIATVGIVFAFKTLAFGLIIMCVGALVIIAGAFKQEEIEEKYDENGYLCCPACGANDVNKQVFQEDNGGSGITFGRTRGRIRASGSYRGRGSSINFNSNSIGYKTVCMCNKCGFSWTK